MVDHTQTKPFQRTFFGQSAVKIWHGCVVVLLLCGIPTDVWASRLSGVEEHLKNVFDRGMRENQLFAAVHTAFSPRLNDQCSASAISEEKLQPVCGARFQSLATKDIVKIQVSYGYTDIEFNSVKIAADYLVAQSLRQVLTQPCPDFNFTKENIENFSKLAERDDWLSTSSLRVPGDFNPQACGFRVGPDNQTLSKVFKWGDGRERTLQVRIQHSAVSTDDNLNQLSSREGGLLEGQILQSQIAKSEFQRAARNNEILFYDGHARSGTGMDFGPHAWLFQLRGFVPQSLESIESLSTALSERTEPIFFLGLLACNTSRYKQSIITKSGRGSPLNFLVTNDFMGTTNIEGNESIFITIESILRGACELPKLLQKSRSETKKAEVLSRTENIPKAFFRCEKKLRP